MSSIASLLSTPTAETSSASSSASSSSSSSNTATITANDFLTLLVTELKNQDPTNASDPNEYVNQLCQINSLEELVSINSTLSSYVDTSSSSSTTSTTSSASSQALQSTTDNNATAQGLSAYHANSLADTAGSVSSATPTATQGNLSIPSGSAAATRLSQALNGQS